jgi:hypothetical protein
MSKTQVDDSVIDVNTYRLPFGIYKKQLAKDVCSITEKKINKMGTEYVDHIGVKYLKWLLNNSPALYDKDRLILTTIVRSHKY